MVIDKKKNWLILILILSFGTFFLGKTINSVQDKRIVQDLTSKPKLVELGSKSCASCKAMMGVLDELKITHEKYIKIEIIDVFNEEEKVEQYKIRAIPTQVVFDKNQKEVFRHEGFISASDLDKKFRELGFYESL